MPQTKFDSTEVIERLDQLRGDPEPAHCDADDILCELLEELGYGDVVEAYKKVPKWYA